jgi:hypothetical protein
VNESAERIESLKAGTVSALSLALVESVIAVGNSLVLAEFERFTALHMTTTVDWLGRIAIAFISGFLFGITYRYVIRDDENSHLKDGAVLAFGLVRGLAPVEINQSLLDTVWLLGVLSLESLICFLVARFTLDWAFHHHWIKPLKSS